MQIKTKVRGGPRGCGGTVGPIITGPILSPTLPAGGGISYQLP